MFHLKLTNHSSLFYQVLPFSKSDRRIRGISRILSNHHSQNAIRSQVSTKSVNVSALRFLKKMGDIDDDGWTTVVKTKKKSKKRDKHKESSSLESSLSDLSISSKESLAISSDGKDKRRFFFKDIPKRLRNKLLLDEVAMFSVTSLRIADQMSEILQAITSPSFTITDGTACIGGNVISFSHYFKHVQAIEIDSNRCEMLQHNVNVLSLPNVECICGDLTTLMPSLVQDILFMDPPWGGVDYDKSSLLELKLSNVPLHEICEAAPIKCKTSVVALKLPHNYNLETLIPFITAPSVTVNKDFKRMIFVILDYRKKISSMQSSPVL